MLGFHHLNLGYTLYLNLALSYFLLSMLVANMYLFAMFFV